MFFIFLKNLTKIKILNPMNRQTTLQQDPGVWLHLFPSEIIHLFVKILACFNCFDLFSWFSLIMQKLLFFIFSIIILLLNFPLARFFILGVICLLHCQECPSIQSFMPLSKAAWSGPKWPVMLFDFYAFLYSVKILILSIIKIQNPLLAHQFI